VGEKKLKNKSETAQYISIFVCWLAYVSVYFGRYSYSANIALVEEDYGVSHASAGLVMTFFSIAYGSGQLIHGVLCKYYPRKYIVSFALIVAGIMDLIVFLGVPFYLIKYLWLISAVCQSILWPMLMQVISENVSAKLMKTAVLVMSTTTSFGTLLIYGMSAVLSEINYKLTFLIGSIILFVVAAIWFFVYKPGGYIRMNFNKSGEKKSESKVSVYLVFAIALLIVFSIVINFVKDGLQTWVPVILKKLHGMPDNLSILTTLTLPLFGIFGATAAVLINKKIKKIIPLSMLFLGSTAIFNLIVLIFQKNLIITVFAFGILELLLHGCANVIVSIFPLNMREKMSSGALAGILNGSAYVGSAASSYLLGRIADVSGWSMVFLALLGTVVAALVLGGIYLIFSIKKSEMRI